MMRLKILFVLGIILFIQNQLVGQSSNEIQFLSKQNGKDDRSYRPYINENGDTTFLSDTWFNNYTRIRFNKFYITYEEKNEKSEVLLNVKVFDSTFQEIAAFEKVSEDVHTYKKTIIEVYSNNLVSWYVLEEKKYVIKDAKFVKNLMVKKKYTDGNYWNYGFYSDHYFQTEFYAVGYTDKTEILNLDFNKVFEVSGNPNVEYGFEVDGNNSGVEVPFFKVGKKTFDLYSKQGQLIDKGFSEFRYYKGARPEGVFQPYYVGIQKGKSTIFKGEKLLFSWKEGDLESHYPHGFTIFHPNQFIVRNKEGITVFDSLGNKYNQEPFEEVIAPYEIKEDKWKAVKKDGEWYFVDDQFNPKNESRYLNVEKSYQNYIIQEMNGLYYCYNLIGEKVIDLGFEEYYWGGDSELITLINGKSGLIENNRILLPNEYDLIESKGYTGLVKVVKGDDILLYDMYGELFYDIPKVDDIVIFNEELEDDYMTPVAIKKNGKYTLVSRIWNEEKEQCELTTYGNFNIIDVSYDEEIVYEYYLFYVHTTTGSGVVSIGSRGFVEAFPPVYDEVSSNEELFYDYYLIELEKGGKVGLGVFNHEDSKILLPVEYDEIEWNWDVIDYSNCIIIKKGKDIGYFDLYGHLKIPVKYQEIVMVDEFIMVKQDKLYGAYNPYYSNYDSDSLLFPQIIPAIYTEELSYDLLYQEFGYNFAECIVDGRKGDCIYGIDTIYFFDDVALAEYGDYELYEIEMNGYIGLMSYTYDTLIPMKFESIKRFANEDWYEVYSDGHYGLYDYYGQVVLPCEYDELRAYEYGSVVYLLKDGKWGIFMTENNTAEEINLDYESIEFYEGWHIVQKDGKWGVLDYDFNTIVPFEYKSAKLAKEALQNSGEY